MGEVVDEGKDDGVEHGLCNKRGAWRERQEDAGRQNEKQHSGEERHHGMKHAYTDSAENNQEGV